MRFFLCLARSRIEIIELEVSPRPRKKILTYFETPVVRDLLNRFGKFTNTPAVEDETIVPPLPPIPVDLQPPFPDAEMTRTV